MPTSSNGTAFDLDGPADAPSLILLHGLGLNRAIWDEMLPALEDRHRVLNYDLAGHGQSAPPAGPPSLGLFARQLVDLMNELEIDDAILVGFSLGGMINRRFAMDYPDRVRGLGILNSPHERSAEAQALVERRALDTSAGGPGATLDATIERWFTADFITGRDDVIQRVRGWVLANDPEIYAACRQVLAFGVKELIRPHPPLRAPTLVMTCEHDSGSTPEMTRAIADEIDGASQVIVPGLQHLGMLERPGAFSEALDVFLDSLN